MYLSKSYLAIALLLTVPYPNLSTATLLYRRPSPPNTQLVSTIQAAANLTTRVIPGGSPFFYLSDPAENLFSISSISMTPTPCQIGLPCALLATGTFRRDFPSISLNFDIEARSKKTGQSAQILAIRDELCDWATVEQPGRPLPQGCGARRGVATIGSSMDLVRGWIMEATYFIDLKLTSGERVLTHIGAMIELRDPNRLPPVDGNLTTS